MSLFWRIVAHEDAVQIKFEIAKGLAQFTIDNTSNLYKQKLEKLASIQKSKKSKDENETLEKREERLAKDTREL